MVCEAILENPGIIMEAVALIQQREDAAQVAASQAVLNAKRQQLENDPNAPVLGNPEPAATAPHASAITLQRVPGPPDHTG